MSPLCSAFSLDSGEHRRRGCLRVVRLRVQPLAETFLPRDPQFLGLFLDKALDDVPMLLDEKNYNVIESEFDSTIFEMDRNYVLVDHEKPILIDNYIVEFVHDSTENYYERGKYGCWSSYVSKTPLLSLQVLTLRLLYLPMLNDLCFIDLFAYKMSMHRKRVRLKCV